MKLWMLVPHYDFPANGPLVLGSIIANLSEPGDSLNEEAIVEIPQSSVHTSHKYEYCITIECTTNGGAGVVARFLRAFSWGRLGANFDAQTSTQFVTENTAPVRGSVTPCLCLYIGASCPLIYSSPERQKQRFRFVTVMSLFFRIYII
jgi:hypothetical protein